MLNLYKRFRELDKGHKGYISSDELLNVPELSLNPLALVIRSRGPAAPFTPGSTPTLRGCARLGVCARGVEVSSSVRERQLPRVRQTAEPLQRPLPAQGEAAIHVPGVQQPSGAVLKTLTRRVGRRNDEQRTLTTTRRDTCRCMTWTATTSSLSTTSST